MTAFFENIRKIMGWCPYVTLNKKIIIQKDEEIFEMGPRPSLFRSIRLNDVYVVGITKINFIYLTMVLIFVILWFSQFFNPYLPILMLLFALLLQFTLSKTSVEITDKHIRLTHCLTLFLGQLIWQLLLWIQ